MKKQLNQFNKLRLLQNKELQQEVIVNVTGTIQQNILLQL